MPVTYYVDGYNVIYHCSQLGPLAGENFEAARDALIDRVSQFCGLTGDAAKIVFDGRGRAPDTAGPTQGISNFEVVYSPGHQTADALIERGVYMAGDRKSIVVVSSDQGIRDLCRGLGALVITPNNFLKKIEHLLEEKRSERHDRQHRERLPRLEDRVGHSAVERLHGLRKKLQPPTKHKRQG